VRNKKGDWNKIEGDPERGIWGATPKAKRAMGLITRNRPLSAIQTKLGICGKDQKKRCLGEKDTKSPKKGKNWRTGV